MLMHKDRTMTLELSEFCIKVFEDRDSNKERAGEQEQLRKDLRKYEEILKEKETPLSRRNSSAVYP
jgi:cell shape-determining protein MreC